MMKAKNLGFKDVYSYYEKDDPIGLRKAMPLHEAVLDTVLHITKQEIPKFIEYQNYGKVIKNHQQENLNGVK